MNPLPKPENPEIDGEEIPDESEENLDEDSKKDPIEDENIEDTLNEIKEELLLLDFLI